MRRRRRHRYRLQDFWHNGGLSREVSSDTYMSDCLRHESSVGNVIEGLDSGDPLRGAGPRGRPMKSHLKDAGQAAQRGLFAPGL